MTQIFTWRFEKQSAVSQADGRLPVPELDQKSISHFLFHTGKTVKVHGVLWNGDMVGWSGEERLG